MQGRTLKGSPFSFAEVVVTSVRSYSGYPYVDCVETFSGRSWEGVPFITGGGTPGNFSAHTPKAKPNDSGDPSNPDDSQGSSGVVLLRRGDAICFLGCIPSGKKDDAVQKNVDSTSDDLSGVELDGAFSQNANGKASIASDGSITADVSGSDNKLIRMQLGSSGSLRVSRNNNAGERAALALALKDYMQGGLDSTAQVTQHTQLVGTEPTTGWLYNLYLQYISLVDVLKPIITAAQTAAVAAQSTGAPVPINVAVADAPTIIAAATAFNAVVGFTSPVIGPPPLMPDDVVSSSVKLPEE